MTRKAIIPGNEAEWHALRARDVTSTESAALFGMSPYCTKFELWHRKRDGVILTLDENERMEWGTELQDSIATVLARRNGVMCDRITEYISLDGIRMGASFDYEIAGVIPKYVVNGSDALALMFMELGVGIFEIKQVDYSVFRKDWPRDEETGRITAPGHIEIQLQHQMHVRGNKWGAFGILCGGNKGMVVIRKYDPEVGAALQNRIIEFWRTIEADEPPPPVYPGDEDFVCKLYSKASPGKIADVRGNAEINAIVADYQAAKDRETLAAEDKKIAHAKLLSLLGDASKALVDGYSIDLGITKAGHVSYDRKEFRRFKMTPTGEKR